MIDKPPFKGLNIRIPTIIPIKGRGFINQGSGLACIPTSEALIQQEWGFNLVGDGPLLVSPLPLIGIIQGS